MKLTYFSNDRRRFWKRAGIATLVAAALAGTGAVLAHGHGGWGWRHDHMPPELMTKHVDLAVDHLLYGIDVTKEQKNRIHAIVTAAVQDLKPLAEKRREARRAAVELLSKPAVDRAALENFRLEQMRLADSASKRIAEGVADVAEVLTPDQRVALAGKLARFHGRMGGQESMGWRSAS